MDAHTCARLTVGAMFPDAVGHNLDESLLEVNALRARALGTSAEESVEQLLEILFGASSRLAAYGTLRPGETNHHWLDGIAGTWWDGFVLGETSEADGYPIIRLDPEGDRIPVQVLESKDLPDHWHRLDGLEGVNYRRSLVAVHGGGDVVTVANVYEAIP